MIVLQAGVPKSGNLWLYQILERSLEEAGLERRRFITGHPIYPLARTWRLSYPEQAAVDVLDFEGGRVFCRISNRFREAVDLDVYRARASHVWTHSEVHEADIPSFARFDRIVCIVRDPRDVALSMAHFAFTPYMIEHYPHSSPTPEAYLERHLVKIAKRWAQHVGGYLRARDRLPLNLVCYERLLADFATEYDRLLAFLGLELDAPTRQRVAASVSFAAMRASRPNHLRAGRSEGWRAALSPAQIAAVAAVAGPMLDLLGYPRDAGASAIGLPEVPMQVDVAALAEATAVARYSAAERWRNRAGRARTRLRVAWSRRGSRA